MTGTYPPRRILVPTDFSEQAAYALGYAVEIARATGADIDVLHVAPPLPPVSAPLPESTTMQVDAWQETIKAREASARKDLDTHVAPYREDVGIHLHWAEGDPPHVFRSHALEYAVDLVVVGSHGRTGFRRALLGSIAERAARLSPSPVLIVREHTRPEVVQPEALPPFPPKCIVVPTDFSETSRHGLEYAASLARRTGAKVKLLHVLPALGTQPLGWADAAPTALWSEATRQRVERIRVQMSRETETLLAGLDVKLDYTEGVEATEIAAAARTHDCDLIVLASHGRSGLSRALLGSVAERTARLAPCPVLIVK